MPKLNASIKGVITGLLMVGLGLALHLLKTPPEKGLQFISYFIFGLGLVWAIYGFAQIHPAARFSELFNQGFRCFMVVALIMALYTIFFYKANPGIIENSAELTRQELMKKESSRTPAEVEEMVKSGKKNFIPIAASVTVFEYLLIGVVVTSATAGILSISKKN